MSPIASRLVRVLYMSFKLCFGSYKLENEQVRALPKQKRAAKTPEESLKQRNTKCRPKCKQLQQRLTESEDKCRALTNTVEDLKYSLRLLEESEQRARQEYRNLRNAVLAQGWADCRCDREVVQDKSGEPHEIDSRQRVKYQQA